MVTRWEPRRCYIPTIQRKVCYASFIYARNSVMRVNDTTNSCPTLVSVKHETPLCGLRRDVYNVFSHLRVNFPGKTKPHCGFPLSKKMHLCQLLGWSQTAANLILAWIVAISPLAGIYAPLLQCLFTSFFSLSLAGSVVIRGELHTILLRCRLRTCWDKLQTNLMRSREPTGPPNNYYIEPQVYWHTCAVWIAWIFF